MGSKEEKKEEIIQTKKQIGPPLVYLFATNDFLKKRPFFLRKVSQFIYISFFNSPFKSRFISPVNVSSVKRDSCNEIVDSIKYIISKVAFNEAEISCNEQ